MNVNWNKMIQDRTMKQKAYGTLASSEMHTETVDQLMSLPLRAVVLRHFEEEKRTTPKILALIAIPYVRTELQLRIAWCLTELTMGEYESEERRRSKKEKVLLMTSLRDLIIWEGAAVACEKRRHTLCFVRFLLEQMSVPALNICVKMLRESSDLAKSLLLQARLNIHQGKPMRVNMKEHMDLEPLKRADEIR